MMKIRSSKNLAGIVLSMVVVAFAGSSPAADYLINFSSTLGSGTISFRDTDLYLGSGSTNQYFDNNATLTMGGTAYGNLEFAIGHNFLYTGQPADAVTIGFGGLNQIKGVGPAGIVSGTTEPDLMKLLNSFSALTYEQIIGFWNGVGPLTNVGTITSFSMVSNNAPVLSPISDMVRNVGQTIAFTASATDSDIPAQQLTFSLTAAPTNATIFRLNNTNAAFRWRPLVSQVATTNFITLAVMDNGTPVLTTTRTFKVTINSLVLPYLVPVGPTNGQFSLQIMNAVSGPDYAVQISSNLVDWTTVSVTNWIGLPLLWVDSDPPTSNARYYRVKVGPPLP